MLLPAALPVVFEGGASKVSVISCLFDMDEPIHTDFSKLAMKKA
jgi:hypothetical protein